MAILSKPSPLVFVLVLAACGGGDSNDPDRQNHPDDPNTEAPTAPDPSGNLSFLYHCKPDASIIDGLSQCQATEAGVTHVLGGFESFTGTHMTHLDYATGKTTKSSTCAFQLDPQIANLVGGTLNADQRIIPLDSAPDALVTNYSPPALPQHLSALQTYTYLGSLPARFWQYSIARDHAGQVVRFFMERSTAGITTCATSEALNLAEVIPLPRTTVLPGPQPDTGNSGTLACASTRGSGTRGIRIQGNASYQIVDGLAQINVDRISFSHPTQSSTGTLKFRLSASQATHTGQTDFRSHGIVDSLFNAHGKSELLNGDSVSNILIRNPAELPPAGGYCITLLLQEYAPDACASDDGFCIVDYIGFRREVKF